MSKLIIGISGQTFDGNGSFGSAGAGKDCVADLLRHKHRFEKISFADPLKRICMDVFGFTEEQLWGPSALRNTPDPRWLHRKEGQLGSHIVGWDTAGEPVLEPTPPADEYLTPRYALQKLGSEWGRDCSYDVWVRYALQAAEQLFGGGYAYEKRQGVVQDVEFCPQGEFTRDSYIKDLAGVTIPDVRFANEHAAIRAAGGKVIRVRRKSPALLGAAGQHESELGLSTWEDEEFDYVIENDGDLEHLALLVDRMMNCFSGRILPYNEGQEDVPPFKRN